GAPLYARTEKGGFAHYLVVEMKNGTPTIKVVEPGHLYAEAGPANNQVWLVSNSDLELPVRRIEASVPASLGACDELKAESRYTNSTVTVSITQCTTSGQNCDLTMAVKGDASKRASVPIFVHK